MADNDYYRLVCSARPCSLCSRYRGAKAARCSVRQCFVVATLVSKTPAEPFIFRNYEHPAASQRLAEQAGSPTL